MVLSPGTEIRTHTQLESTRGMLIAEKHLLARRPGAVGVIGGYVPGHGGDVYWVRHGTEEIVAVYCFTEFELENIPLQNLSQVVD